MAEPIRTIAPESVVADEPPATVCVVSRRRRDDSVVVTVQGEIDLSNISLLEKELAEHEHETRLVLDMSRIRFCAVCGARLLHTTALRSSTTGQRFELVGTPAIERLLKVTGFAGGIRHRIPVESDESGLSPDLAGTVRS